MEFRPLFFSENLLKKLHLDSTGFSSIDGGLPSKSQATSLFEEFFVDFNSNIGHFGTPDNRFELK
jgi:hypothetical protein